MIIEYENYQLRPYSNGLCWQIWEYRTVYKGKRNEHKDWCPIECYPSSLGYGLVCIYEKILKEDLGTVEIKQAIKEAKRIKRELLEATGK